MVASAKELVAVIADTMGVPIETVTVIDRFLAEAGLRTRALRGRGHTPMTYRDAANLIIATAIGAQPKDAVRTVEDYSSLPAEDSRLGKTFGDALANLIEAIPREREDFSAHHNAPNYKAADIRLIGPKPQARIELLIDGMVQAPMEYGSPHSAGDLRRTVEFTQVTLGFVGAAIAEDLSEASDGD